jgi:hypothetical protein
MAKVVANSRTGLTRIFSRFVFNQEQPDLRRRDGSNDNGRRWYDYDPGVRGL